VVARAERRRSSSLLLRMTDVESGVPTTGPYNLVLVSEHADADAFAQAFVRKGWAPWWQPVTDATPPRNLIRYSPPQTLAQVCAGVRRQHPEGALLVRRVVFTEPVAEPAHEDAPLALLSGWWVAVHPRAVSLQLEPADAGRLPGLTGSLYAVAPERDVQLMAELSRRADGGATIDQAVKQALVAAAEVSRFDEAAPRVVVRALIP